MSGFHLFSFIFWHIQELSRRFHLPDMARMLWNLVEGCRRLWKVVEHSRMWGMSWNVMECHRMLWNVVECHGMLWNVTECHGISWNVLEHSRELWKAIEPCGRFCGCVGITFHKRLKYDENEVTPDITPPLRLIALNELLALSPIM